MIVLNNYWVARDNRNVFERCQSGKRRETKPCRYGNIDRSAISRYRKRIFARQTGPVLCFKINMVRDRYYDCYTLTKRYYSYKLCWPGQSCPSRRHHCCRLYNSGIYYYRHDSSASIYFTRYVWLIIVLADGLPRLLIMAWKHSTLATPHLYCAIPNIITTYYLYVQ